MDDGPECVAALAGHAFREAQPVAQPCEARLIGVAVEEQPDEIQPQRRADRRQPGEQHPFLRRQDPLPQSFKQQIFREALGEALQTGRHDLGPFALRGGRRGHGRQVGPIAIGKESLDLVAHQRIEKLDRPPMPSQPPQKPLPGGDREPAQRREPVHHPHHFVIRERRRTIDPSHLHTGRPIARRRDDAESSPDVDMQQVPHRPHRGVSKRQLAIDRSIVLVADRLEKRFQVVEIDDHARRGGTTGQIGEEALQPVVVGVVRRRRDEPDIR